MELKKHSPPCEDKSTHMSDVKAKVTDILSDRLGVLTTLSSNERILFDIEELYLADDKCDPSYPLSSYVRVGRTLLQCDASFLIQGNEWNIQYEATCVWSGKKPSCTKIFGPYMSNCSTAVRLVPGCVYKGHIVKVSPPITALAIAIVTDISVPVLIFLNRLFKNSRLVELPNYEWIQDHLNIGDIVEFQLEGKQKTVTHKKFHVAAFAWRTELRRKNGSQQNIQGDMKWCNGQDDNMVSNAGTYDVTERTVSHVGTSAESDGSTSLQSMKGLIDEVFVGTVESFTLDDGFGVVNFQLQDEKVKAIFFRESIFVKGVSVTDMLIKKEITAGRLVTVSHVTPYYTEDILYAANIDTELQDKVSDHAMQSYSPTATCRVQEQETVKTDAQNLKFSNCEFTVKQGEMFYRSRQYYDGSRENETDSDKDVTVTDTPDDVRMENSSCAYESVGDENVTPSSDSKQSVQLPVIPTQHTGIAKQLKGKLARVKRYESSTRGVLECSISGAEMEVIFHKSAVNFYGRNEATDLEQYLPVGREVYFEGDVVGEDRLLGCPDIVVTRVWEGKQTISKVTNVQKFQLTFAPLHEGLVAGRPYVGIVTQILPPHAFVATVTEAGKTYDVFVLNTFFNPVEYGMKLPEKCPVISYVAEGYKVHVLVNRMKEENSKYMYEWFAVYAWTEQGDNVFSGRKPEEKFTPKELDTEDLHDYLEGVIVTLYPEWGILKVKHFKDEVTFFGQDTFLFGVQLGMLDLRQVFKTGEKLCFILAEETAETGSKKASRVWFGSHDTSSDIHDISLRSVSVFNFCSTHKIDKAVLLTLTNELGKQCHQLETGRRIQTSSVDEEGDNVWLKPTNENKASGHIRTHHHSDSDEESDQEEVYYSDSSSIYMSDEKEENHVISCAENFVDQLESVESSLPCSSNAIATAEKKAEVPLINNAETVISCPKVSNLEKAEDFSQNQSPKEGIIFSQESEHATLPVIVETIEESQACIDKVTSLHSALSTEQYEGNMKHCPTDQHMSVLHPEMQRTLQLSLLEALHKCGVKSDMLHLITSRAVLVVEEQLKGVLRGKLLDKVLKKVTQLGCSSEDCSEVKVKAMLQIFQTLNEISSEVSEEWKQIVSGTVPTFSITGERREQEDVDDGHMQLSEAWFEEGCVDQATQTVSTGSILFLKVLPDL